MLLNPSGRVFRAHNFNAAAIQQYIAREIRSSLQFSTHGFYNHAIARRNAALCQARSDTGASAVAKGLQTALPSELATAYQAALVPILRHNVVALADNARTLLHIPFLKPRKSTTASG